MIYKAPMFIKNQGAIGLQSLKWIVKITLGHWSTKKHGLLDHDTIAY